MSERTMTGGSDLSVGLARVQRRERWIELGLTAPALALIVLLLLAPLAWLAVLSFVSGGEFSLEHYGRLFIDPIYARSILLTLKIALIVTALSVLLGYPVSYLLSQLPRAWATIGLTLVMIPFWTSLLVRTYAWLVLLQRQGLINRALTETGVVAEPLYLAHNEVGTIIGMLHIMLPFLVLPLYATMRRIDVGLLRAAASLGASPLHAFWRIYFPLSLPGLVAGAILVFVLSLGFYITPAILGGGKTLMIAMLIERSVNLFFEWGPASALAIAFVAVVLGLFYLLNRLLPAERLLGGH
jgi:putative spermidine/putrescine transport system permease protein